MKIIVDAMGGDNAPHHVIQAAVEAVEKLGIDLIMVGKEEVIKPELSKYKYNTDKLRIVNATEVISNDDAPAMAIKSKKDSSMVVGLKLLKDGEGDAFISAGNTGALMAGALFIVKRIKGVDRPALAPTLPTLKGPCLLIDAGSNVDCTPNNLMQFGVMGSIYMNKAYNIEKPKVGIVNVGSEESKGDNLTRKSFELLKETSLINFIGNVEGREIPEGKTDVVVCDGFVGNVILKVMEGMGLTISRFLKQELKRSFLTKIGALLSMSAFKNLKKKIDYKEYGGALLIGVNGPVVKAHGSSDAKSFYNTIKQAVNIVETGLVPEIEKEISQLKNDDTVTEE